MEDQKQLRIENLYKLRTKLLQDVLHWMSDEELKKVAEDWLNKGNGE